MKKALLSAAFAGLICPAIMAQTVTVGTSGADYTSLNAAVQAVGSTNDGVPDIINILDEGPFLESRVIINAGVSGTDDLTIQALPGSGLRPRVVVKSNADGAFYLRKSGNVTIRDLIILPTVDFNISDNDEYIANVPQAAIGIDDDSAVATSVTLQNVLVSSNDGNNQPVASLDGLTSPTFTANTVSFRDEGVQALSAATNATRNIYMYDFIVSGVAGDQGSDGIRGFIDGAPGSEWVIGPGCVVSYNNHREDPMTSTTTRGAVQTGGTGGLPVKIQGTQDKPVKLINNNLNGIDLTDSAGVMENLTEVSWCIVANNAGVGYKSVDSNTPVTFTNVTFANNGDGLFHAPPNADEIVYTFSNVIAAGNGGATDLANIIELIADGSPGIFQSTFSASDSAIVLEGPYTLNNVDYGADGIASDSTWNVVLTDVIDSDPQFVSLDPTNPGFAIVTNNADYGTAGPLGGPLVGGGDIAPSSVEDWQLF